MATRLSQWNKAAPALIEQRGAIRYGAGVLRHDQPDAAPALATMHDVSTYGCRLALADAVVDSVAKAGNDRLPPWQR